MPGSESLESGGPLERALGYTFRDKGLLELALTAPSCRGERQGDALADNQRLEFLGDAVVGLLAAGLVYARYTDETEGGLSVRRSHLTSGRALARVARRIGLGAFLRLGRADEQGGGRDKDKPLVDALEALFGAAWCDGGLPAAERIFATLLGELDAADEAGDTQWQDNPKGRLQELAQRHAWPDSPRYETVGVEGPAHAPHYTVRACVAGGAEAYGAGTTKRAAEAEAASRLLERLLKEPGAAASAGPSAPVSRG